MAKVVDRPSGQTLRVETDDELVRLVQHRVMDVRSRDVSRDDALGMTQPPDWKHASARTV